MDGSENVISDLQKVIWMRSYKREFVAQPEGTPRFQSELCRREHVEWCRTARLESPVTSPRCCLLLLTGMLDWSCPGRRLKMETSNQCFSPWLLNKDNCEIRGRNCSWISSCWDRWVSHVAVKARGVWSEESPSCRQVSPKGEQWASNTRAEGLQQAVAVLGKGTAAVGVKTSEPSNLN